MCCDSKIKALHHNIPQQVSSRASWACSQTAPNSSKDKTQLACKVAASVEHCPATQKSSSDVYQGLQRAQCRDVDTMLMTRCKDLGGPVVQPGRQNEQLNDFETAKLDGSMC